MEEGSGCHACRPMVASNGREENSLAGALGWKFWTLTFETRHAESIKFCIVTEGVLQETWALVDCA